MLIAALPASNDSILYQIFRVLAAENPEHKFALPAADTFPVQKNLIFVKGAVPEKVSVAGKLQRTLLRRKLKGLKPDVFTEEKSSSTTLGDKTVDVLERFTKGNAFIFWDVRDDSKDELIANLKAFSQLKSRQQTEINLVFWSADKQKLIKQLPELTSYKYRADVHLLDKSDSVLSNFAGAAWAIVAGKPVEDLALALLALQTGIPLITGSNLLNTLIFRDAALPCAPGDIGTQMQLLYKDENLRKKQVGAGRERARVFGLEAMF